MKYTAGGPVTLFFKPAAELTSAGGTAEVRVLHEGEEGKVYEDVPWTALAKFGDGYTGTVSTVGLPPGEYVVVYRYTPAEEGVDPVSQVEHLTLDPPGGTEPVHPVRLFGVVRGRTTGKGLEGVRVVATSTTGDEPREAVTDYGGGWSLAVTPGDLELTFSLEGYEDAVVRAQVGDREAELPFNAVSLTPLGLVNSGAWTVSDAVTDKYDMPLEGVLVTVTNGCLQVAQAITGPDGRWEARLDLGDYVASVALPSGDVRYYAMRVSAPRKNDDHSFNDHSGYSPDRTKAVVEFEPLVSPVEATETVTLTPEEQALGQGSGGTEVTDVVVDAHGQPVVGALVRSWSVVNETVTTVDANGNEVTTVRPKPTLTFTGSSTTDADGRFTLRLDQGRYRLAVTSPGFKSREQYVTV